MESNGKNDKSDKNENAKTNDATDTFRLFLRQTSGVKFTVTIPHVDAPTQWTVRRLKDCLWHTYAEDCRPATSVSMIRLIYKGRILHDDSMVLSDVGIVHESTVFMVLTNKASASSPNTAADAADALMANSRGATDTTATSTAAPPDWMELLTASNPALRDLAASNPTIRHALSDPATLRDALSAATNPHARAQQERSHELQLAQLENLPGGMAALTSLYHSVSGPLSDGFHTAENASSVPNLPSAAQRLAGASGTSMPNPWGHPSRSSTRSPPGTTSGSSTNTNSTNTNSTNTNTMTALASLLNTAPPRSTTTTGPDLNQMMQAWHAASGNAPTNQGNPWMPSTATSGSNSTNSTAAPTNGPFPGMNVQGAALPSREQQEALVTTLEQNPAMVSMMEQMVARNPGMVRALLHQAGNSNAGALPGSPHAALLDHLTDEQLSHMVTQSLRPNAMRSVLQMQDMLSMGAVSSNGTNAMPWRPVVSTPTPASPSPYNPWARTALTPAAAVDSRGAAAAAAAAVAVPNPNVDDLVALLRDMGFAHDEASLRAALQSTQGNLHRAVDVLLALSPGGAVATDDALDTGVTRDPTVTNVTTDATDATDAATGALDDSTVRKGAADKKND